MEPSSRAPSPTPAVDAEQLRRNFPQARIECDIANRTAGPPDVIHLDERDRLGDNREIHTLHWLPPELVPMGGDIRKGRSESFQFFLCEQRPGCGPVAVLMKECFMPIEARISGRPS